MKGQFILIAGGYGEVGRRTASLLESEHPGSVVVAGRHPDSARWPRTRHIDVESPGSIESALDDVRTVLACVRQAEPHLLHAAVRRGIGYTSIAPPPLPWSEIEALHLQARATGARIVFATGIEPGISSVLVRLAADQLGKVDAVETALLLGVGDAYGADSLGFLFDELAEAYTIRVDGVPRPASAFKESVKIAFPAPFGTRRAYTMPFRDQLYYPMTLGAQTAIARLALDPPWLGRAVSMLARLGVGSWSKRGGARESMHGAIERVRQRYAGCDRFALMVEVRGGDRVVRSSLVGQNQADATAAGAAAVAEALHLYEVGDPGVWLAEQVIAPAPFLSRLAARGLSPVVQAT